MLLADVNGVPMRASRGLTGLCRSCGAPAIAKCGSLKAHHWAHAAGSECDSFSEPIGDWHLSWQNMIRTDNVEYVIGSHRADILGNRSKVIELQHSSISVEQIAEREKFYDSMVWLFDATSRFRMVSCGDIAFFAFGQSKHITLCKKPVFLDFGSSIIEVVTFNDRLFPLCSGYGVKRDREWFIREHLSEVVKDDYEIQIVYSEDQHANPWERKRPYFKSKYPLQFINPSADETVSYPGGRPCLKMNYVFKRSNRPISHDVIDQFPDLANGWQKTDIDRMKKILRAQEVIFEGKLRLLPHKMDSLGMDSTVENTQKLLLEMEPHMRAGRIPVLEDSMKQKILESARAYEQRTFGKLLRHSTKPPDTQLRLF